jgi:hypothetical protein
LTFFTIKSLILIFQSAFGMPNLSEKPFGRKTWNCGRFREMLQGTLAISARNNLTIGEICVDLEQNVLAPGR